ncbi:MAG: hypothetical protein M3Y71_19060 [Actinomycetota bacterium]|nr:hypothetical protein [Actinomycetota bacterium]
MSEQPPEHPTAEPPSPMDAVEHAIDDAKQAEADLRALAPDALKQPQDDPMPNAFDSED